MDLSTLFSNETLALITPPLVSAVLTMFYAIEGWKKSGEDFNIEKFATTMGTELITLIVIAGICFGFDLTAYPSILAFAPTIATILITQAISWYNKRNKPKPPLGITDILNQEQIYQDTITQQQQQTNTVHTINIVIQTKTPQQEAVLKEDKKNNISQYRNIQ